MPLLVPLSFSFGNFTFIKRDEVDKIKYNATKRLIFARVENKRLACKQRQKMQKRIRLSGLLVAELLET